MTDFHCQNCRTRVRVYFHKRRMMCASCGEPMLRGRGRKTRPVQYVEPANRPRPAWRRRRDGGNPHAA